MLGLPGARLFVRHGDEAGDDQDIADAGAVRGGAVDGDDSGTPFGGNRIGGETIAVGDVPEVNGFILQNTGRIQEILVNGA